MRNRNTLILASSPARAEWPAWGMSTDSRSWHCSQLGLRSQQGFRSPDLLNKSYNKQAIVTFFFFAKGKGERERATTCPQPVTDWGNLIRLPLKWVYLKEGGKFLTFCDDFHRVNVVRWWMWCWWTPHVAPHVKVTDAQVSVGFRKRLINCQISPLPRGCRFMITFSLIFDQIV